MNSDGEESENESDCKPKKCIKKVACKKPALNCPTKKPVKSDCSSENNSGSDCDENSEKSSKKCLKKKSCSIEKSEKSKNCKSNSDKDSDYVEFNRRAVIKGKFGC